MDNPEKSKAVLIVISGMSPAVITETVWAMAMQKTSVVPDKVVVLTTMSGKSQLMKAMGFEGGVPGKNGPWGTLKQTLTANGVNTRGRLKLTEQTIKVFTGEDETPLDDLRTRTENLLAANLMMKEIREYTDDEDWVVYAQLAGGRKTMSALFFSCMCLLGRPCDHIYHVLVSDGYDKPGLEPPFLFPQKGVVHKLVTRDGKEASLPSAKAKIDLFDVPFVPMGEWAEQKCKGMRKGLSYQNVIDAVNAGIESDVYPKVEIDLSGRGTVLLNGSYVRLSHFEFVLFVFIVQGKCPRDCLPLIYDFKEFLCNEYEGSDWIFENCRWLEKFIGDETKDPGHGKFAWYRCLDKHQKEAKLSHDLSYTLSELRKALPQTSSMARLTNRDAFPSDFDRSLVFWKGLDGMPKAVVERLLLSETRERLGLVGELRADNPRISDGNC